ncbi:cysteine desulfurase [Halodesulfurarchaeum formicicum]|uniref:Cysteine desulfurase n=1 Tax=Halodesulfurarchaeum formicicum TaxID=1873524 RepID=A0A1D8S4J2_9EURY|nr:aminotransferase class V-fold PLP-dependent enzyme [Halodesulfurarchaeum formicicum]AOW80272.1 cysteine desulfurase [Halodesulfurarchaeum formicicum]APE95577.1 cysteine desulfurase / selenocysteine lyase [Halodesulfurarchaeum formicicum]
MADHWGPASDPPATIEALRESIPALADHTYLNWGASGPSPRTVVEATESALEYHEYDAVDDGMYTVADEIFDVTRDRIANFVGADPTAVALTQSTTAGINRIASAIDFDPGAVVVTTDLEHAAGRLPWTRLAERANLEIRVIETENGRIDQSAAADALEDAELFCFSAIDWLYGRVHPVPELTDLAHEQDAVALVDAVQVPGQYPIDVSAWGADIVAGAGHKWLLGPWGAGFLYVSAAVVDDLEPTQIGYRSVASSSGGTYQFHPDATRFELGTMSPAPFAGLRRAIETIEKIGPETIHDRIREHRERFVAGIDPARLRSPEDGRSGLVTVRDPEPERTVERLAADSITLRAVPLSESIRISFHAVNSTRDVDRVLAALNSR